MPLPPIPTCVKNRALMHAEVRAASRVGDTISTDCARAIAWEWHRGQATALCGFAAIGQFDDAEQLLREIEDVLARPGIRCLHSRDDVAALRALRDYVRDRAEA